MGACFWLSFIWLAVIMRDWRRQKLREGGKLLGLCLVFLCLIAAGCTCRSRAAVTVDPALTLYVAQDGGSDDNDCAAVTQDGPGHGPCLTIHGALRRVPKPVHQKVTLDVTPGVFQGYDADDIRLFIGDYHGPLFTLQGHWDVRAHARDAGLPRLPDIHARGVELEGNYGCDFMLNGKLHGLRCDGGTR